MIKVAKFKVKDKIIPLQATSEVFSKISIIAQKRSIDLKSIFCYPLRPLPWSLAEPMGTLKKTSKATLMHKIEGETEPVSNIDGDYALIVDAMAYVQQAKVNELTYSDFATNLLKTILSVGRSAKRIDVVFDVYKDASIKNIERNRRSQGRLSFQKVIATATIKQWAQFMSSSKNKNELIIFVNEQWQLEKNTQLIGDKELYVTCNQKATLIRNGIFLLKSRGMKYCPSGKTPTY